MPTSAAAAAVVVGPRRGGRSTQTCVNYVLRSRSRHARAKTYESKRRGLRLGASSWIFTRPFWAFYKLILTTSSAPAAGVIRVEACLSS